MMISRLDPNAGMLRRQRDRASPQPYSSHGVLYGWAAPRRPRSSQRDSGEYMGHAESLDRTWVNQIHGVRQVQIEWRNA